MLPAHSSKTVEEKEEHQGPWHDSSEVNITNDECITRNVNLT